MILQIIGIVTIVIAALLGALVIGAQQGWATPFDSESQRREITGYIWKLFAVGAVFLLLSMLY